jgi:transcriptional regulator with XRE-family HTH domain
MDTKTLGQLIREIREEKDFSLRELAKKIDITPAFLSDIELGRRNPSEKTLQTIARVLKIPIETLRNHDTRFPLEDLKRLATSDPRYGLAFRKVIDEKIKPEDLLDLINKKMKSKKQ